MFPIYEWFFYIRKWTWW